MLERHGVAYLADEVGMGKTYVALATLALFRHYDPTFAVLVLAPRENIQRRWMKELKNFVAHNVRFPDLRVKAADDSPARGLVACDRLLDLVRETSIDPNRDFFLRMSSFSLPLGNDRAGWQRLRDDVREHLPWMKDEIFDLRNKETFKDNFARALCCALPVFDLVIVDEAHNLSMATRKTRPRGTGSSAWPSGTPMLPRIRSSTRGMARAPSASCSSRRRRSKRPTCSSGTSFTSSDAAEPSQSSGATPRARTTRRSAPATSWCAGDHAPHQTASSTRRTSTVGSGGAAASTPTTSPMV